MGKTSGFVAGVELSNPSSSMSQKELSEAPLNCCHLALLGDELLLIFEHSTSSFPKTGVLCHSFPDEIKPGIQRAAIICFSFSSNLVFFLL
jgi:hypothetical protein